MIHAELGGEIEDLIEQDMTRYFPSEAKLAKVNDDGGDDNNNDVVVVIVVESYF